jgi:predicted flap endonuclease-1-like 5' DNA nuclease
LKPMDLEPISVGIGLVIGIPIGLLIRRRRIEKAANNRMRDLKTRLTSLQLRFERSQNELAAAKGVVAKLLSDRQKTWDGREVRSRQEPELTVVLNDVDAAHQLSKVRGIGPKLAVTLARYGITDLEHLAEIDERELSMIEASAPTLAERLIRERWKEQAIELLQYPDQTPGEFSPREEQRSDPEADEYSWARFRGGDHEQAFNGSSN